MKEKKEDDKIKIVTADDHPLFLYGVRVELESIPNFKIIGESVTGGQALDMILELNPDVAILDYQMPGLNGIEITSKLREMNNKTKIILLTMYNQKKIFFKALETGVKGYVLKDEAVLDIVNAVNNVVLEKEFISSNIIGLLVEKLNPVYEKTNNLFNSLTTTEKKILILIADFKSNKEISDALFISKRTIENYKVNISKKLNLKGSREILKFAVRNQIYLEFN